MQAAKKIWRHVALLAEPSVIPYTVHELGRADETRAQVVYMIASITEY